MAIKPIIFNTDMVRAILDGRKTVTRRVVKPQPLGRIAYCMAGHKHGSWSYPGPNTYKYWGDEWKLLEGLSSEERNRHWTPPCHTDDILYVRETFAKIGEDVDIDWFENSEQLYNGMYIYKADGIDLSDIGRWHPSIHMPTAAARIFLRVTDVHVELLHDMSDKEAEKEGIGNLFIEDVAFGNKDYGCVEYSDSKGFLGLAKEQFAYLWDSTIKKNDLPKYGWSANPWVWVIDFKRCEKPLQFADMVTAPSADQPVLMPAT